jgi:DNA-binding NarL/FixJ family response regulator
MGPMTTSMQFSGGRMADGPTNNGDIRMVVSDNHPIVLAGLEAVLAGAPGIEVVGRCTDGGEAISRILDLKPDVALVSMRMPSDDGLMVLRRLRDAGSECRVVLFTGAINDDDAMEAIRLGAGGILLKELPTDLVVECVRKVARGERWLEQETTARVLDRIAGGKGTEARQPGGLTARELQLVKLAARGMRNGEIARRLRILEGTVKIHMHNIYKKLGLRGRVQLALYARTRGLA